MRPDYIAGCLRKQATDTVSSVRQQAPAARMIGEFAVKHLLKEAERISRRFTAATNNSSPDLSDTSSKDV